MIKSWFDIVALIIGLVLLPLSIKFLVSELKESKKDKEGEENEDDN